MVTSSPVEGLHEYVSAPLAVKVAELPIHMEAEFTVRIIAGATVTEDIDVLVQPSELVPVTVYMMLPAGVAITLEPVVEFNPAAGDQE